MVDATLRTGAAVYGVGGAVRARLVSLRSRAVSRLADRLSRPPGSSRRPDDSAVAIAAAVELPEGKSRHRARDVGYHGAGRAGRGAVARRLDHRQHLLAVDL